MKAIIMGGNIILAENGEQFDLLGTAERYGFDEGQYAVAKCGEIHRSILVAFTLPWPWNDREIEIQI